MTKKKTKAETSGSKDFEGLVEKLRREAEDKRNESKPQAQVWAIIHRMQLFQEAVARANAPRDFKSGSTDPDNIERLRKHRQIQKDISNLEFGMTPLAGSLVNLGCHDVIGDEAGWRVSNNEWEKKVWKPLHAWVARGYQMLFGNDVPKLIPEMELIQWEKDELQLEHQLLAHLLEVMPEDDYPIADEDTFRVRWRNEECDLGNHDPFRLMKCLLEARGRYVSHDDIAEYLSNEYMTGIAIRKLVERLCKALEKSPCRALAKCIVTDNEMVKIDTTQVETVRRKK